jgi:hypothetical protein
MPSLGTASLDAARARAITDGEWLLDLRETGRDGRAVKRPWSRARLALPLTTVLLARALLGERLGALRTAGVCIVLCGIGLLSAGSA